MTVLTLAREGQPADWSSALFLYQVPRFCTAHGAAAEVRSPRRELGGSDRHRRGQLGSDPARTLVDDTVCGVPPAECGRMIARSAEVVRVVPVQIGGANCRYTSVVVSTRQVRASSPT